MSRIVLTVYFRIVIYFIFWQTELAASAGVVAVIMARIENDTSTVAPTTRIYKQDGDSFKVPTIPVFGATFAAGKLLRDFLDLSNTVSL